MGYKNIKHSILFSFLFWVGSVQSGHAQETAGQEVQPAMKMVGTYLAEIA